MVLRKRNRPPKHTYFFVTHLIPRNAHGQSVDVSSSSLGQRLGGHGKQFLKNVEFLAKIPSQQVLRDRVSIKDHFGLKASRRVIGFHEPNVGVHDLVPSRLSVLDDGHKGILAPTVVNIEILGTQIGLRRVLDAVQQVVEILGMESFSRANAVDVGVPLLSTMHHAVLVVNKSDA